MTPVPVELYDELEYYIAGLQQARQRPDNTLSSRQALGGTSEIAMLGKLAQQFQAAPPLQVDSAFARRLERRLLARNESLQRGRTTRKRWHWTMFGESRAHAVVVLALSLLIVVIVMTTSVLVVAGQIGDPTNPLYGVKRWEQQVQVSLANSPTDQAELHLHFARDQLTALENFTETSQASSYQEALADFDEQLTLAIQEIQALPAGTDQDRLHNELATLQMDARQTLRQLLSEITLPERLLTTGELGRLGDTVPSLLQVQVTLPAHPNGLAIISISGNDLQANAQLLVNGRPVAASGILQAGAYLFSLNWHGNEHPQSIGILNPDDTATQTTHIRVQTSTVGGENGGNGNGNGGGNDKGGGKGRTKPNLEN